MSTCLRGKVICGLTRFPVVLQLVSCRVNAWPSGPRGMKVDAGGGTGVGLIPPAPFRHFLRHRIESALAEELAETRGCVKSLRPLSFPKARNGLLQLHDKRNREWQFSRRQSL